MPSTVVGYGLGLFNLSAQGQGASSLGQASVASYVNARTGNLVLNQADTKLAGLGIDPNLLRTYNSLGQMDDANGDNWRFGVSRIKFFGRGVLVRQSATGTETNYGYNGLNGRFESTDGSGAHDYITTDGSYKWHADGNGGLIEEYNSSGQLIKQTDRDGNITDFTYNSSGALATISNSGQTLRFVYSNGTSSKTARTSTPVPQNVTSVISETFTGNTSGTAINSTVVRYEYDSYNRLTKTIIDLTPEDNSIADGKVYETNYSYDGTSKRVALISQTDGTSISFSYGLYDGAYKVEKALYGNGEKMIYEYGLSNSNGSYTRVTNEIGQSWNYFHNESGQLTRLESPVVDGQRLVTQYSYDNKGNVISVTDPEGSTTVFEYDGQGNLTLERDALGNTVFRTYNSSNLLLSETVYLVADPDGAGAGQPSQSLTSRYVYDSEGHLRFQLNAEGEVTEFRYQTNGVMSHEIRYSGDSYSLTGLTESDIPTLTQMNSWLASIDKSQAILNQYSYDFRGQLSTSTSYEQLDSAGNGIGDGAVTSYVYDYMGRLLETISALGNATSTVGDYRNLFAYDGMGRLLSTTSANGQVSSTRYLDSSQKIVTSSASGLYSTTVYDHAGRVVSVSQSNNDSSDDNLGSSFSYYDNGGQLRAVKGVDGAISYIFYDSTGRVSGEVDASGSLVEYQYNKRGQVTKTIAYATEVNNSGWLNLSTGQVSQSNLDAIRPADQVDDRIISNLYGANGQLIQSIDGENTVTTFSYDGAGRLVKTLTGSRFSRNFYDAVGRTVAYLDARGALTENIYNDAGQLIKKLGYANLTTASLRATANLEELRPLANLSNDVVERSYYNDKGQLIGQLNAESYLTELSYDLDGNLIGRRQFVTAASGVTDSANYSSIRPANNSNDQVSSYQYNQIGQLIEETNFEGTVTQYTYDNVGNLIASDIAGRRTYSAYDERGQLTHNVNGLGSALLGASPTETQIQAQAATHGTRFVYDLAGRVTMSINANGDETLYFYDAEGNAAITVDAEGGATVNEYNAFGEVSSTRVYANVIDMTGLVGGEISTTLLSRLNTARDDTKDTYSEFAFNARGQLAKIMRQIMDNSGAINQYQTQNSYDYYGQKVSVVMDKNLSETINHEYEYDQAGLLVESYLDTDVLEVEKHNSYDAFGRLISSLDANGNLSQTKYDRLGRVITLVNAEGATNRTYYDAFDRVVMQEDAAGEETSFYYNAIEKSIVIESPNGDQVKTIYNAHGEKVTIIDGNGNETNFSYDQNGQLEEQEDALGGTRDFFYDQAGRLLWSTDQRGIKTEFSYNKVGRILTQTIDPTGLALTTQYSYDAKGQVMTVTDPRGSITETHYDTLGQVKTIIKDAGGLNIRSEFEYNGLGNQVKVRQAAGTSSEQITEYQYDNLGRRTSMTLDPAGLSITSSYQYDNNNNLIKSIDPRGVVTAFSYDSRNLLKQTVADLGGKNITSRNQYDVKGQKIKSTDANNTETSYVYDDNGRLTSVILDPTGLNLVTQYEYDANGNKVREINANGVVSRNYFDALNRLIKTVKDEGGLNQTEHTEYDSVSNIITTIDALGVTSSFSYDFASRLQQENKDVNGLNQQKNYQYDANGNLIKTIDSKGIETAYIYDQVNRQIEIIKDVGGLNHSSYTEYDQLSNVTKTIDSNGNATHYLKDSANRTRFIINPHKEVTEILYDKNGNKIEVRKHQTVLSSLSGLSESNVLAQLDDRFVSSHSVYNKQNLVRYSIDAEGAVIENTYDPAGRLIETIAYEHRISLQQGNWSESALENLLSYSFVEDFTSISAVDFYLDSMNSADVNSLSHENGHLVFDGDAGLAGEIHTNKRFHMADAIQTSFEVTTNDSLAENYLYAGIHNSGSVSAKTLFQHSVYFKNGNIFATQVEEGQNKTVLLGAAEANTKYHIAFDTSNGFSTMYVYKEGQNQADGYSNQLAVDSEQWGGVRFQAFSKSNPVASTAEMYLDNLKQYRSQQGRSKHYVNDALGRNLYSVDGSGHVVQRIFDSVGQVIETRQYNRALNLQTQVWTTDAVAAALNNLYQVNENFNDLVSSEFDFSQVNNSSYSNAIQTSAGELVFESPMQASDTEAARVSRTSSITKSEEIVTSFTIHGQDIEQATSFFASFKSQQGDAFEHGVAIRSSVYQSGSMIRRSAHINIYSGNPTNSTGINALVGPGLTYDNDKTYQVEIVTNGIDSTIYVYEQGLTRDDGISHTKSIPISSEQLTFKAVSFNNSTDNVIRGKVYLDDYQEISSDSTYIPTHFVYDDLQRKQFSIDGERYIKEYLYDLDNRLIESISYPIKLPTTVAITHAAISDFLHGGVEYSEDFSNLSSTKFDFSQVNNSTNNIQHIAGKLQFQTFAGASTSEPQQVKTTDEFQMTDNKFVRFELSVADLNNATNFFAGIKDNSTEGGLLAFQHGVKIIKGLGDNYYFSIDRGTGLVLSGKQAAPTIFDPALLIDPADTYVIEVHTSAESSKLHIYKQGEAIDTAYVSIASFFIPPSNPIHFEAAVTNNNLLINSGKVFIDNYQEGFLPQPNVSEHFVYDDLDRNRFFVDAQDNVTEKRYDANGNVIEVLKYSQPVHLAEYNLANLLAATSNISAVNEKYTFDAKNKLQYQIDSQGVVTKFEYDTNGNLVKEQVFDKHINLNLINNSQDVELALLSTWNQDFNSNTDGIVYSTEHQGLSIADGELVFDSGYNDTARSLVAYRPYVDYGVGQGYAGQVITGDSVGSEYFLFTLDGNQSWASRPRIALYVSNGYLKAYQHHSNNTSSYNNLAAVKANTTYQVEYETQADKVIMYLYEKGSSREEGFSHEFIENGWDQIRMMSYTVVSPTIADGPAIATDNWFEYSPDAALPNSIANQKIYDANNLERFSIDAQGNITEKQYNSYGLLTKVILHKDFKLSHLTDVSSADAVATRYQQLVNSSVIDPVADVDVTDTFIYNNNGKVSYQIDAMGYVNKNSYNAHGDLIKEESFVQPINPDLVANEKDVETALLASWNQNLNHSLNNIQLDNAGYTNLVYHENGQLLFKTGDAASSVNPGIWQDTATSFNAGLGYRAEVSSQQLGGEYLFVGLDNEQASSSQRRYGVLFKEGQIWANFNSPATGELSLGVSKENTTYVVELETLSDRVRLYVYEKGSDRHSGYNHELIAGAWGNIKLRAYTQAAAGLSGQALSLDNLAQYQHQNQPASIESNAERYIYDKRGQVIAAIDALGNKEQFAYDERGNRILMINKKGADWHYKFDKINQLIEQISPETTYYERNGETLISKQQRVIKSFEYDFLGNTLAINDGVGTSQERSTQYKYDNIGNQLEIIVPQTGAVTISSKTWYDSHKRAVVNKDVTGGYSYKVYTADNKIKFEIDNAGYVTSYQYNAYGHKISSTRHALAINSAGHTVTDAYTIEEVQNRLSASIEDRSVYFEYDALGQQVRVLQNSDSYFKGANVGGTNYQATPETLYEYDSFGNLTKQSIKVNNSEWEDTYYYYDLNNKRIGSVDANRYLTIDEYDGQGNLITHIEYARQLSDSVDLSQLPAAPNQGNDVIGYDRITRFEYDELDRQITVIRSTGPSSEAIVQSKTFDALGNVISNQNALGAVTSNQYDELGRSIRVTASPRQAAVNFTSPFSGNTTSPTMTNFYDVHGNKLRETEDSGTGLIRSSNNYYDHYGNLTKTKNALGHQTEYLYDKKGQLTREKKTTSHSFSDWAQGSYNHVKYNYFVYNQLGQQVETRTDSTINGVNTTLKQTAQYNAFGEQTLSQVQVGNQSAATIASYYYNNNGQLKMSIEEGVKKEFLYNLKGSVTRQEVKDSEVTINQYDKLGNISRQQLPTFTGTLNSSVLKRPVVEQVSDRWGNVINVIETKERKNSAGSIESYQAHYHYQYNSASKLVKKIEPQVEYQTIGGQKTNFNPITSYTYNLAGQLTSQTDAKGNTIFKEYDNAGNLILEKDALGHNTYYAYDGLGRKIATKNSFAIITTEHYDLLDRVIEQGIIEQNAAGISFELKLREYKYDQNNNRTESIKYTYQYSSTVSKEYTSYDRSDQVKIGRDAVGREKHYRYDFRGKKTWEQDAFARANANGINERTWNYDLASGKLLSYTDLKGRLYEYLYNAKSEVYQQNIKQGSQTIESTAYQYYENGLQKSQVKTVNVPTNINWQNNNEYGSINITETAEYEYDISRSKVTENYDFSRLRTGSYTTQFFSMTGGNWGWVTLQHDYSDEISVARNNSYQYDALNRLTEMQSPRQEQHKKYIKNGNVLIDKTELTTGINALKYAYDKNGNRRSVTSYYFRRAGDTFYEPATKYYDYDANNRMVLSMGRPSASGGYISDQGGVEITYDSLGRRATMKTIDKKDQFHSNYTASNGDQWKIVKDIYLKEFYTYNNQDMLTEVHTQKSYENFQYQFVSSGSGNGNGENELSDVVNKTAEPSKEVSSKETVSKVTIDPETNSGGNGELIEDPDGSSGGGSTSLPPAPNNYTGPTYLTAKKTYDLQGRVTVAETWVANQSFADTKQTNLYFADGQLQSQITRKYSSPGISKRISSVSYVYDVVGNIAQYSVGGYNEQGTLQYTSVYDKDYEAFNSYKELQTRVATTANHYAPGVTDFEYDIQGNLLKVVGKGGEEGTFDRDFVYSPEGNILVRIDVDKSQDFYYHNGKQIASAGEIQKPDFDYNFQAVSSSYPASTPSGYVVNQGDTLRSIAQNVYGDSNLWYLIAEANAISDDSALKAGMSLKVPNVVSNTHNTSETFKPYNPADVVGDTSPSVEFVPPPPPKKGCGIIGVIIMAVVAVVVTIYTAGAAAPVIAAALSTATTTVAATSLGVLVIAGAVGGALGAAAGQLAGMAMGNVDKFDWGSVAIGAISGAATAGVTGLANGIAGGAKAAKALTGLSRIAYHSGQAMLNSVVSYGANALIAGNDKFDWASFAVSAVAAPLTAAGPGAKEVNTTGSAFGKAATKVLKNTAINFTKSATISLLKDGKVDNVAHIAADSFGNALGGEIASHLKLPGFIERLKKKQERVKQVPVSSLTPKGLTEIPVDNSIVGGPLLSSGDNKGNPGITTHTVKNGESLSEILLQYGYSLDDINVIAAENGLINPNQITAGQTLTLSDYSNLSSDAYSYLSDVTNSIYQAQGATSGLDGGLSGSFLTSSHVTERFNSALVGTLGVENDYEYRDLNNLLNSARNNGFSVTDAYSLIRDTHSDNWNPLVGDQAHSLWERQAYAQGIDVAGFSSAFSQKNGISMQDYFAATRTEQFRDSVIAAGKKSAIGEFLVDIRSPFETVGGVALDFGKYIEENWWAKASLTVVDIAAGPVKYVASEALMASPVGTKIEKYIGEAFEYTGRYIEVETNQEIQQASAGNMVVGGISALSLALNTKTFKEFIKTAPKKMAEVNQTLSKLRRAVGFLKEFDFNSKHSWQLLSKGFDIDKFGKGFKISETLNIKPLSGNPSMNEVWQKALVKKLNSSQPNLVKKWLHDVETGALDKLSTKELNQRAAEAWRSFRAGVKNSDLGLEPGTELHHWNFNKGRDPANLFNVENLYPVNKGQHKFIHKFINSGSGVMENYSKPIMPQYWKSIDSSPFINGL